MPGVVKLNPDSVLYDENGHPVGVVLDGSVYRLQTETKMATGHGLAVESKQDTLLTELQKKADLTETQPISAATLPLPSGASTEATLALVKAKTDNLDVALSTRTKPTDLQKAVLNSSAGNPVNVVLKDSIYRLAVDTKQGDGQASNIGQAVPENLARYYRHWLDVVGTGAIDMKVNGSSTPVVFAAEADPTKDVRIQEVRVVMTSQDFVLDGTSFGNRSLLTNGILFEIVNEYGTQTIANIKSNEDFLFFPSPIGIVLNNTGPKDVLIAGFYLAGSPRLRAGTSDVLRATVRDNLTTGIDFLRGLAYGIIAE
jgi:hypothetical protein